MDTMIRLPDKLKEQLQEVAEIEQVSVAELVEIVLNDFVTDRTSQVDDLPNDEEIEAVKAAIHQANQPGAKRYNSEEFDQELKKLVATRRANRRQSSGQGAV